MPATSRYELQESEVLDKYSSRAARKQLARPKGSTPVKVGPSLPADAGPLRSRSSTTVAKLGVASPATPKPRRAQTFHVVPGD